MEKQETTSLFQTSIDTGKNIGNSKNENQILYKPYFDAYAVHTFVRQFVYDLKDELKKKKKVISCSIYIYSVSNSAEKKNEFLELAISAFFLFYQHSKIAWGKKQL